MLAYPKPVLVLVDAACASSCEGTVLYVKSHPQAVVIGEPTGGYVHFGDTGTLFLPHSHLQVSVPTKYFRIEGNFYERSGITPDIPVEAGTDALDVALRWLQDHLAMRQ